MSRKTSANISISARGGDDPKEYFVPEGFKGKIAAFGSDAPHLKGFERKIICGPGSILRAHTPEEDVLLSDIDKAITNNIKFYETVY